MSKGKGKQAARSAVGDNAVSRNMRDGAQAKEVETIEQDELMASLKRHDEAFNSLLSLIPAQFYVAPKSEGSSASDDMADPKYMKNKRKQDKAVDAAEKKLQIKEAKRAKLDPDNFKSAAQVQQERAAAAAAASPASSDEMQLDMDDALIDESRAGDTDTAEDDDDDDDDDDEEDDSSSATQLTSVKGSEEAVEVVDKPAAKEIGAANGIQDLRARLQAKIQGLQSKRKAPGLVNAEGGEGDGDDDSVASTKDELLEERRRKRGEMRDKRRQAMKQRRRKEKEQSGQDKKGANAAGNANKGGSGNNSKPPALLVPDQSSGGASRGGNGASTSGLAFSSLEFGDDQAHKGKKNRHTLPSDPKAALAIVEARKKKEEARQAKRGEEGEDGVKERKEREKWSKAEAAAQGVKIRDDEALLRKAAKKKDKIKDKSRKEWTDREKEKADQAASRQKKRNDNIAARKDRSKKGGKGIGGKKMGGGKKQMGGSKKTRARPGFEGKERHSKGGAPKKAHK